MDRLRVTPRLGFLGVGWIGRERLAALAASGAAEIVAIADPSAEAARGAQALAPDAALVGTLEGILASGVDGVVIATPSAGHAGEALRALDAGAAVFCQKPLGRDAGEVAAVVAAAREADRLLGVDLSYRHTAGMAAIRDRIAAGGLGRVHAAELTFHNAYGPDKPWFRDRARSGGGCVIDLGTHLVDLCLWTLGFPAVEAVRSRLFAGGAALPPGADAIEDFALAELDLASGAVARIACSWNAHLGRDAEIAAVFHGASGGAAFRNLGGSFYEFAAELHAGTGRETLAAPPDAWGGRGLVAWTRQLAADRRYDAEAAHLVGSAQVIDRIYGR